MMLVFFKIQISNFSLDIWGKLTDMIRACGEAVKETSAAKKRAILPPPKRVRQGKGGEEGIQVNVKVLSFKRTSTSGKRT
jgi:hypothetical protein